MIPSTMGKVLWVDLSSGMIWEETIPDELYERCLGGIGLAAALLLREIPARAGALERANRAASGGIKGLEGSWKPIHR